MRTILRRSSDWTNAEERKLRQRCVITLKDSGIDKKKPQEN